MSQPQTIEDDKLSLLEKFGISYMRRRSQKVGKPDSDDELHILNPHERKMLRKIERGAVIRAGLAGAISATLSAGASVIFWDRLGDDPMNPDWQELWAFWSMVGLVTLVATVAEIIFLYLDALRSVHRLANAAGLDLFPEGGEEMGVARVMVRAALEIPNPPTVHYGVDPRREVSKLRLFLSTVAYKAKVTVTNFLIKAIVRKIVGRAGARAAMEFVAVPVFAIWNSVICFWVVREARIRAMGPSAAEEISRLLFPSGVPLDPVIRRMSFRAIGACIVKSVDLHPNLIALFNSVYKRLGDPSDEDIDDSEAFLDGLAKLAPEQQDFIIHLLEAASIIDGRLAGRERKIILEAREVCKMPHNLTRVKRLRKNFTTGQPITRDILFAKD